MMRLESRFIQSLMRQSAPALFWASRMFPIRTRDGLQSLYLFYRVASDLVLNAGSREEAVLNVDRLRRMLETGRTDAAVVDQPIVDQAILDVPDLGLAWEAWCGLEEEFGVPRAYAAEFASGLAIEASGSRPENVDDLLRYTYMTGGVIGLIAFHVLYVSEGVLDAGLQQTAVDIGSSVKLTELASNIYRDFTQGRIFAPVTWAPTSITRVFSPRWADETAAQFAAHAAALSRAARPGLSLAPLRLRLPIATALAWHRESRCSILRKFDRTFDEMLRQIVSGLRKRSPETTKPALSSRPPFRDSAIALRNQNILLKRDVSRESQT